MNPEILKAKPVVTRNKYGILTILAVLLISPVMRAQDTAQTAPASSAEVQELRALIGDRKSTRLYSSHTEQSRMPSSA